MSDYERALESQWRIAEFKTEMTRDEGRTGNDIRDGLEITGTGEPVPRDTASLDPGWADFEERAQAERDSEAEAWNAAANATQDLALREAVDVMQEAESDEELVLSAAYVATNAPERYGEFLGELVEYYDEDYAKRVHAAVSHNLAEQAKNIEALDFAEEMQESEDANYRDVARAIEDLALRKGMSQQDVNKMEAAYREGTGQFLRSNMLAVMPADRAAFLDELRVQAETDERSERERMFKASFFKDSRDVADGLRGPGVVPRDLPPSVMDPNYARFLTEQRVRKEDAERAERPTRTSEREIKMGLVAPSSTDIDSGLTDASGRPTTYRELASRDPDSQINVEKRAQERAAMKWRSLAGG